MVLLLLSFMADSRSSPSDGSGTTSTGIAYLAFGLTADTLRVADPSRPGASKVLFEIPHAAEYGILPSISPAGDRFAYTALPEGVMSPGPETPAELWMASLDAGSKPRLLADDVDLLVEPVWTPDGLSVVYRRSADGPHTLALGDVDGGEERIVAYSETEALFPIAFDAGGASLYYVGLNETDGSRLYEIDLGSGMSHEIATLADGLTRDWQLSPDGSQLAFLEVAFEEASMASRASVLDIGTGEVTELTPADEIAFGPVWGKGGDLAIGTFDAATQEAGLLVVDGMSRSTIDGPSSGFHVPLSYDASADAYLVRTFENDSVTSPGRSALVLLGLDGKRTTIAEGEVTFVGWTHP